MALDVTSQSVRVARNKHLCEARVDRISNFPPDVTQTILECLPLQEAAKTSILSKNWRYKWTTILQLKLHRPLFISICRGRYKDADISSAYTSAVNVILLSHIGLIIKFMLYIPNWFPLREIQMWIRYVSANGVKELCLEYANCLSKLTYVLSCSSLTHLTLIRCKLFSLPPKFTGFPCLIHLKLENCLSIVIEAKVLEILISRCSQLESLHLLWIKGISLTIHAPKLKYLFVKGFLFHLKLEGIANMNTLALKIESSLFVSGSLNNNFFLEDTTCIINTLVLGVCLPLTRNMREFFRCLPKVEKLVLKGLFWKTFSTFESPTIFPKDLEQLRTLDFVDIQLNYYSHISIAHCLFNSSTHLEQLYIKVREHEEVTDDQPFQIDFPRIFQCLRNVQFLGLSGLSNELQLLKFHLARSPVLEEITVELGNKMGVVEQKNFAIETMQYLRASPTVEIITKTNRGLL